MTDLQLRKLYPYLPEGSDYARAKHRASPDWGEFGATDYPTSSKIWNFNNGSVVRSVQPVDGTTSYTIPKTSSHNTWTSTGEADMWNWYEDHMIINGNNNPYSFLLGQYAPNSNDTTVQSWQRGVVGFSLVHQNFSGTSYYGHYIDECTMLFRKGSDASKWYGVDMVYNANVMPNCINGYSYQSPFKVSTPKRGGTGGGFYLAVMHVDPVYKKLQEEDYVFQGIYMLWKGYDSTPVTQRVELFNYRLIYDSSTDADGRGRLVAGRNMPFQDSWDRSRPLKIT